MARVSRYTRWVRVLRIGLPLLALVLMSTVFLVQRDDFAGGFRFSAADYAALQGGLRLVNPTVSGATDAGEPFVATAEWALPDGPNPTEIALHGLTATLTQGDGRRVDLTAAEGTLRPRDQRVRLTGAVRVTTSDGYVAETEAADADLKARTLSTDGPVVASGPMGRIEAGRMRILPPDAGADGMPETVWFENRVRVVYLPTGQVGD